MPEEIVAIPVHERICQWLEDEYIPQKAGTEMGIVLSKAACAHLTALSYIPEGFAVGDDWVYAGHEDYSCSIVSTFTTYNEEKPAHRTGGRLFTFKNTSSDETFEVLLIGAWVNDDNINIDMVAMVALPKAHITHWQKFENECARIARSAIPYRDKVYIVGGRDVTFDATTAWDDIHLPVELKESILHDVDSFFKKGVAVYQRLNINPFRKLLFAGVPGTGKTMLCSALARWAQSQGFFVVYVSGANQFGAQFWKIHQALDMAASSDAPTIVIVEELDAYLDDDSKAQLLNVLDGSETPYNDKGTVLIATTNHPEIIDDRVLKRPGRLDRIFIVPELSNEDDAEQMLRAYLGEDWQDDHTAIVPDLVGRPGAFVREVALYALTMAAYQDLEGLPLEILEESLETLVQQIEAKEDFLISHKRRPIGLAPVKARRNGKRETS